MGLYFLPPHTCPASNSLMTISLGVKSGYLYPGEVSAVDPAHGGYRAVVDCFSEVPAQ